MLDYGYRSKCCFAPIRLGKKKLPKLNRNVMIWVCTKCQARDIQIIPKDGSELQPDRLPFSERG